MRRDPGFWVMSVGLGVVVAALVLQDIPLLIAGMWLVLGVVGHGMGEDVVQRWRDKIKDKAWCEGFDAGKAEAERVYGLTLDEGQTRIGWEWPEPDDFLAPERPPLTPEELARMLRAKNDAATEYYRWTALREIHGGNR